MMDYQIHLENFTGPLDLLLFFIRRDEIDVMDIPIARITEEYLFYIETLQTLNVAVAGEFLMMAATLMRIKARMLLPQVSWDQDEEAPEDPRAKLVQQLLEYQRYSEAAENLSEILASQSHKFPRAGTWDSPDSSEDPSIYLEDISLFELASLFKGLLEKMPPPVTYDLQRDEVRVRDKMAYLMAQFVVKERYKFSELFSDFQSRKDLIATFIALLELVRDGQVRILQKRPFADFVLEAVSSNSSSAVGKA